MSDAAMETTVGPYRIIKAIGAGGSARIDLARIDRAYGFQRHVVIKRPLEHLRADPSVGASLRREAQLGGQLRHPNLVAVLDAGEHDGYDYLALEYIHGASLRTLMQLPGVDDGRVRPLPLGTALSIVIEIARGLHEAHELTGIDGTPLGLVHRDVSPNNILLGADGTVKLADFGIAKDTRVSTLSGSMRGTVTYMAPEQCRGHAFDRRADVFSLGVILFELVTARRLFWADNDVASLHKVLSGVIPDPRGLVPGLAPELAEILLAVVAADPIARPPTAAALAEELEAFAVRAGLATSPRFVARAMELSLGARGAPWIEAAAKTTPMVLPELEASLVGVIERTPDEPEAEFAPPVVDAAVLDAPGDESASSSGLGAVRGQPSSPRHASSLPVPLAPGEPAPAPVARAATRADAVRRTPSHARQRRIAFAVITAASLATVAIVAFIMLREDGSQTGAERGAPPPSRPATIPAPPSTARNAAGAAAVLGSNNAASIATESPPDAAGAALATGSDVAAGSDAPARVEGTPADSKPRPRPRIARDVSEKPAGKTAGSADPAAAGSAGPLDSPPPRDAGVPNDAAPARVEWKPSMLLPTDSPKAPTKSRTP